MGEKTEGRMNRRIDRILSGLIFDLKDMPTWPEFWYDTKCEGDQYDAEAMWRNDVLCLDDVEQLYRRGELTDDQEAHYLELKRLMKARMGLIEQLDLTPLTVSLDD